MPTTPDTFISTVPRMEVLIKGWEEVLDNSLTGEAMGEKEAPEKR